MLAESPRASATPRANTLKIRHPLVIPYYLVSMVLLVVGVGIVVNTVSEYGDKIDRELVAQQRLRQIFTARQEVIEQEQKETAEAVQIALRWRVRAMQLERFIQRQGLTVPAATVPLRIPPIPPEFSPAPPPAGAPQVPEPKPTLPEPPSPEPPPFDPPPSPSPTIECVDLPPPVPDYCVEVPPTPNP